MKTKKSKVTKVVANKGKTKNSKKKKFECVVLPEKYAEEYYAYCRNCKSSTLSHQLNDRTSQLRNPETTARQINSWDSYGLIDVDRDGKEWRKYSIMDAVWLNIILELRKLGYPVEMIKLLKESLQEGSEVIGTPMPFLEFWIYKAILHKEQIVLLVFEDGSGIPINLESYLTTLFYQKRENHIYIDLNNIISKNFETNKKNLIEKIEGEKLSAEEKKLLDFIRNGRFEKVTVTLNIKVMDIIEGKERVNTKKYISDVLKENQHQTVEVKQTDGKIINIVRTIKKKMKDIE